MAVTHLIRCDCGAGKTNNALLPVWDNILRAGFVKEKIKVGICVLSGYKGFLFSDLPEDLSAAVNIIIYKGSTQNDGRYAQGLITDSIGKRYSFVVSQDFSTLSIKPFWISLFPFNSLTEFWD